MGSAAVTVVNCTVAARCLLRLRPACLKPRQLKIAHLIMQGIDEADKHGALHYGQAARQGVHEPPVVLTTSSTPLEPAGSSSIA